MSTPVITIFVRHTPGCKWAGDEFAKKCTCRKHLRWTHNGKQFRKQAGTRSWAEAEKAKRTIEAQLNGQPIPEPVGQTILHASAVFQADNKNEGITAGVLGKYKRELDRLEAYCSAQGVYTVQGITRELLVAYQATWSTLYPSTATQTNVRARIRKFLKFCHDNRWLDRVPKMSRIKVDEAPTLPLTSKEYEHLLATIPKMFEGKKAERVRGLVLLMRWSGLAIRDAVTLRRDEIIWDSQKELHRIVTNRQKTGTHVSVPVPPDVAAVILAVLNGNPVYVFWTGSGKETSAVTNWQHDLRALFRNAGITSDGHMLSHRLRDTFAVDLLEKGVPMEEVSKLLGHESIKTTERSYAKWVKGRQDRLDNLVTGTWAK